MYNVIGDIAGQYRALEDLLKKMPADAILLSIGDMVDRGPQSKEVVEFFMRNGEAILGNHEHMMLNYIDDEKYYDRDTWFYNGGRKTYDSFGGSFDPEMVAWMRHLPLYKEVELNNQNFLISHAFLDEAFFKVEEATKLGKGWWESDLTILWNRYPPVRRPEYDVQLAGHNSQMGLKEFKDEKGTYAICLDDSRKKVLTGIHLPGMQIYQQKFLD
jgi:hypothetical protein